MLLQKITRPLGMTLGTLALAGAAAAITAPAASAAPDSTWDDVAQCESGGNWSTNTGNGYKGGLQFTDSTWKAYGGSGSASNASREQQIAVAERVLDAQGWGAWPSCSQKVGASGSADTSKKVETHKQSESSNSYSGSSKSQSSGSSSRSGSSSYKTHSGQSQGSKQSTQDSPYQSGSSYNQDKTQRQDSPYQSGSAHSRGQSPQQSTQTLNKPAPAKASGETYTVRSGDTLNKIAQAQGVDGGWSKLWAANLDTVSDPNAIQVGQVLNLPA